MRGLTGTGWSVMSQEQSIALIPVTVFLSRFELRFDVFASPAQIPPASEPPERPLQKPALLSLDNAEPGA